jgi:hypothetical protein
MGAVHCLKFRTLLVGVSERLRMGVWLQNRVDGACSLMVARHGDSGNGGGVAHCFKLSEQENLLFELDGGGPLPAYVQKEVMSLLPKLRRARDENGA